MTVNVEPGPPQCNHWVRILLFAIPSKPRPFPSKCPSITMSENRRRKINLLHLILICGNKGDTPRTEVLRMPDFLRMKKDRKTG